MITNDEIDMVAAEERRLKERDAKLQAQKEKAELD